MPSETEICSLAVIVFLRDPEMKFCSNLIVYQEGMAKSNFIRYKMEHVKSVRVEWVFDCFDRFQIVNPQSYE